MADSTVTIVGNLTREPELRYTTSGRPVTSVGVAVSRRFKRGDDWEEQTSFINVVAWGDLGENFAASCDKGDRVMVTGRLEQRSWETREGEKRSVVEVVADEIGPSLRWAQATVEKIARDTGGSTGNTGDGGPLPEEEPFISPARECDL